MFCVVKESCAGWFPRVIGGVRVVERGLVFGGVCCIFCVWVDCEDCVCVF